MGSNVSSHQQALRSNPFFGGSVCGPTYLTSAHDPLCCVSFNVQPDMIDNRHMHAHLQQVGFVSYLHINDLTHHKSLTVKIMDEEEIVPLSRRSFHETSLQVCNVVGLFKDLIVVQVFCQNFIKFFVCCFYESTERLVLCRKYDRTNKLQLYECRFSPDESIIVIKQNQIYSKMFALGSNSENVSIFYCNWAKSKCHELKTTNFGEQLATPFFNIALAFDPRQACDLVVFSNYNEDPNRAIISLYKPKKDIFLFTISLFKADMEQLPGVCHNLQFLADGTALILTITTKHLCRFMTSVTSYWMDPDCFDKTGSFEYKTPFGAYQYMPLISKSGKFAFCGGRIYNIEDMMFLGVKRLSKLCREVIVDSVLPEDIHKLNLPKSILQYLSFNYE